MLASIKKVDSRGNETALSERVTFGDLAFACYHFLVLVQFVQIIWAAVSVIVLVCAAWLWRRATDRYGGLAVPVVSHAASGISIMAAALFLGR